MQIRNRFSSGILGMVALLALSSCQTPSLLSVSFPASGLAPAERKESTPSAVDLAPAVPGSLPAIYERVSPSVVHLRIKKPAANSSTSFNFNFPEIPGFPNIPSQPPDSLQEGEGSGFVWDRDGHIVTNNHVVLDAMKITVVFTDGRQFEANLVGADPDSDLAVLKVDVPGKLLVPVTLADSATLRVGDLAIAIGNPFGQEGTMTTGIVSALGRLLPVENGDVAAPHYNIPDVIQTDAAINPGNSGGVLLNDKGEVIGVTSAILSPVRGSSGVGFAIPSSIVQQVIPDLIKVGRYDHPFLGITGMNMSPEVARAMDLPEDQIGVLVVGVVPEGPADKANLQGSDRQVEIDGQAQVVGGDVIVAVGGRQINRMDDLIADLNRFGHVGEAYDLTILRNGSPVSVPVMLGARPSTAESSSSAPSGTSLSNPVWLGIITIDLNRATAGAMGLAEGQAGILIQQVALGSPADKAGLRGSFKPVEINGRQLFVGGDVITTIDGQATATKADLQQVLKKYMPGDKVTLGLLRDGRAIEVDLVLGTPSG